MSDEMGLTLDAARGYHEYFVPAIFGQWPSQVCDIAEIRNGDDVLDVGCGTGVFVGEALSSVGPDGTVVGFDLSESMLTVAQEKCPDASFQQGNVIELPFNDASFDVVASSFVLMFVPDPDKALSEMQRVLRPGGRLVAGVWQALANNPVYSGLVRMARNQIDDSAGDSLAWPFALGEDGKLEALAQAAGIKNVEYSSRDGRAVFPSMEGFVRTEIEAWLLSENVSAAQIDSIVEDANIEFSQYCNDKGAIEFPMNASFLKAVRD